MGCREPLVRRTQRSTIVRSCLAVVVLLQTAGAREAGTLQKNSPSFNLKAFLIQMAKGRATCRAASADEARHANPSPANRGVPIATLQGITAPISDSPAGLTINLVALSQLQNDSNRNTVIAAFQRAAANWSAQIKTPITITINVDYGFDMPDGTPFDDGVVGSTSSGSVTVDYSKARANLISTAASPAESAIYNSLPALSVPVNA